MDGCGRNRAPRFSIWRCRAGYDLTEKNDYIKISELDSLIRLMEQKALRAGDRGFSFALFKEEVPMNKYLAIYGKPVILGLSVTEI
ncbi:MAG: hypothetical protein ACLUEQ_07810 [Cloacibacillus evryensis]